jgi:hypothetical protein
MYKAVSWGTVGSQHWAGDRASKTHAFDCEIFNGGSHALTLCGREFDPRTDNRYCWIRDMLISYVVDTSSDLGTIDCKQCLKALVKANV